MEPDDLLSLMGARRGHYALESGYHSNLWLDLDSTFAAPSRLGGMIDDLARRIAATRPDVICGPMIGGALIAFAVAAKLEVGFRWTSREQVASGHGLFPYRYHLDSAGVELSSQRVVVVDDVVNAGSATRETLRLLREQGATPVAIGALLTLGQAAEALAREEGLELLTLTHAASPLWAPDQCPRCAAGEPSLLAELSASATMGQAERVTQSEDGSGHHSRVGSTLDAAARPRGACAWCHGRLPDRASWPAWVSPHASQCAWCGEGFSTAVQAFDGSALRWRGRRPEVVGLRGR